MIPEIIAQSSVFKICYLVYTVISNPESSQTLTLRITTPGKRITAVKLRRAKKGWYKKLKNLQSDIHFSFSSMSHRFIARSVETGMILVFTPEA